MLKLKLIIALCLVLAVCEFAEGRRDAREDRRRGVVCAEQPHIEVAKVILDSSFDPRSPVTVTAAAVAGLPARMDEIAFALPESIAQWQACPTMASEPFYSPLFVQPQSVRWAAYRRVVNARISSVRILRHAGSGKPI